MFQFVEFLLPALVVCSPCLLGDAPEQLLVVARGLESLEFRDALAQSLRARRLRTGCLVVPVAELVQEEFGQALVDGDAFERACGVLVEECFGVVRAALVACVVRVLAFLAVTHEEAAARLARDHAGVRERVLARAGPGPSGEDILDFVEELSGDEGLVLAFVGLAAPPERAGVHGVGEEDGDVAARDVFAASAAQADLSGELRDVLLAVRAGCCCLEEFDDEWCFLRVGLDAERSFDVPVPKWRPGRPPAFRGFLVHTFLHLFAEVFHVVLCHEHAHAREEAHAGVRAWVEDGSFLNEVDGEAESLERAVVFEVPGEPIDFFDDERAYVGVLFEEREHLPKARAAG